MYVTYPASVVKCFLLYLSIYLSIVYVIIVVTVVVVD